MQFCTKKWVKPEDLNAHETLFGGRLLSWIDEEAAIYMIDLVGHRRVVTKYMSEINFVSSARKGDVIELVFIPAAFGKTSVTLQCHVRNTVTGKSILTVDRMVFVSLDENGNPQPHGKTHESLAEEADALAA
jgi:acyl-CoA hydrolase